MPNPITDFQEECLAAAAAEERDFQDLLFYYAARREQDKIEALSSELDPTNEPDMLAFELFQGTGPQALMPMANEDTPPWIRYSLMKAFLNQSAFEGAMAFWKKILQWQVPDTLIANTLLQFALRDGHFEEAGNIAAVSLMIAPKQRDVMLWKAMALSKRNIEYELYLDPLPLQQEVTFAITTRGAESYLDQTLSGITMQNYPIGALIVVEETPGLLKGEVSRQCAPMRIEAAAGQPWIAAAASECTTPLLAIVPPDCAPAFNYLQHFILASENGPRKLAAAGGRIEAYYEDKPGDRWREARMASPAAMERSTDPRMLNSFALCMSSSAAQVLARCETGDIHALSGALDDAELETHYLPEAVALCLRQDSIDSALEAYWLHDLPQRERRGEFASLESLLESFGAARLRTADFMNRSIAEGSSTLIFPDFLHFFHTAVSDLRHGLGKGLLDEGAARQIQDSLIETIAPLDAKFKRDLRTKVRNALGARAFTAAPAGTFSADAEATLNRVLASLDALFEAFPQDLYLALIG